MIQLEDESPQRFVTKLDLQAAKRNIQKGGESDEFIVEASSDENSDDNKLISER